MAAKGEAANTGDTGDRGIESIDILVFSMGENRFAIDMGQIGKISQVPKKKESGVSVAKFHEKIGLREKKFSYRAPKAIFLKACPEKAIVIDSPEDIIPLPVGNIRPMPYLIDCCSKQKAIWGASFIDDDIVFLVDLERLQESGGAKK